jgi:hypothetical protein
MTIAELFVKLGFKVEGADELEKLRSGLADAAVQGGKAALGLDLVTAAIGGIIEAAVNGSIGLQKFDLLTGLSTGRLKQWQYAGEQANISAQEMTKTIENVQLAGARVALTGEGIGAWSLLGIDPRQNPFEVLAALHRELLSVHKDHVAAARFILGQAGIPENVVQGLSRKDFNKEKLADEYMLTTANQRAMRELNKEWSVLPFLIGSVSDKFVADLAPEISKVIRLLTEGIDELAKFAEWLGGSSRAAAILRTTLVWAGTAIVALSGFLTAFAVVAKGVSVAMTLVTWGIRGVGLAGAIATSELLPLIAAAVAVAAALDLVYIGYQKISRARASHTGHLHDPLKPLPRNASPAQRQQYAAHQAERAAAAATGFYGTGAGGSWDDVVHPRQASGSRVSNVEQNNTFHVDGSASPAETAKAIDDMLRQQLNRAAYAGEPDNL